MAGIVFTLWLWNSKPPACPVKKRFCSVFMTKSHCLEKWLCKQPYQCPLSCTAGNTNKGTRFSHLFSGPTSASAHDGKRLLPEPLPPSQKWGHADLWESDESCRLAAKKRPKQKEGKKWTYDVRGFPDLQVKNPSFTRLREVEWD